MIIHKLLRIWFTINDIQQKEFAKKHKIHANKIYEILKGIKKNIPSDFNKAFQNQFGFPVEDIYLHIKSELEKGKDSRNNKSKEGKEMEGMLYDVEGLSKERLDILQEMIDNWREEDLNKRKEERQKTRDSKSKKNNSA